MNNRLITLTEWKFLAAEAQFRPSKMAEKCGISERQLRRKCLAVTGMTLRKWTNQVKFETAKTLIRCGVYLKEVAFGLGYRSYPSFSREFKRYMEKCPSEYSY